MLGICNSLAAVVNDTEEPGGATLPVATDFFRLAVGIFYGWIVGNWSIGYYIIASTGAFK